ncbi:MAG: hypothetical protein ABIT04_03230 [Novosphingobium sp.]
MVHLTVRIAKFFGYLLGALFETGAMVIGLGGAGFLLVAGLGLGLRRLIARRRL